MNNILKQITDYKKSEVLRLKKKQCKYLVSLKVKIESLIWYEVICYVTEVILSITAVSEDRGSYAKPHATGFLVVVVVVPIYLLIFLKVTEVVIDLLVVTSV